MIHTSEKIRVWKQNVSKRIDRLIERVNLDRGLLIKEKIVVIMGKKPTDDSSKNNSMTKK